MASQRIFRIFLKIINNYNLLMSDIREMSEKVGVRVLTLKGCDYCEWLKSELDAAGITYVDIDANQFSKFSDEIEDKFKTNHYPITFIDLGDKVITIVAETSLDTTDTLRTFNTIPELVGVIKSYIK